MDDATQKYVPHDYCQHHKYYETQEALLPHDVMCQSKFCQLLHNSVGTTCTTHTEQIEVMELEGYSRPTTYNKLVHPVAKRATVVGVIYKLDRRRVLLTTPSTCPGKIFEVQCLGQSSRGKYPYYYHLLRHTGSPHTHFTQQHTTTRDASLVYRTEPTAKTRRKTEKNYKVKRMYYLEVPEFP